MMRDYLNTPVLLQPGISDDVALGFVEELQKDLVSLGFGYILPDGMFGHITARAVKQVQKTAGLHPDGFVGPDTKKAVRERLDMPPNPPAETLGVSPSSLVPGPTSVPGSTSWGENYLASEWIDDHQIQNQFITPRVPHFSQGDPRWADRTLGKSASLAAKGCAISCVAMTLRFFGREIDPALLDAHLDEHDGYAGDSIKWNTALSFDRNTGPLLRYDRAGGSPEFLLSLLGERIEKNLPTMLRVDYGSDSDLAYNHFVMGVGLTPDGQVLMNDPATSRGDGYEDPTDENILQRTSRKQGYGLVQLDWYEPS